MALNGNALLTIDQTKKFLDIPLSDSEYDDEIEGVVNLLSDAFCRYCGRDTFVSSAVTEYITGKDDETIWLRNIPVSETTSSVFIWIDTDRLYADANKLDRTDYVVDLNTGKVTLIDDTFYSNEQCIKVTYYGGYTTLPGDLVWAAKLAAKYFWTLKDRVGVSSVSQAQGGSTNFSDVDTESGLPVAITAMLKRYRRWSI